MKLTAIMWAALTVVVGISLFLLKYQVQGLEDKLQDTYVQIERDKTSIRVLEAEWTYLNDPGRLRRLSEQYLSFAAPSASQIITISQLPYKNGETPMLEGVSTQPPATTVPAAPNVPLTGLREARGDATTHADASTGYQFQPAALSVAAVSERPSTIANSIARLQRFLPTAWAGTPSLQEPLR